MLAGPEQARLLQEFEDYQHHEEGAETQQTFFKQAQNLLDTITNEFSNPFEEIGPELLVLNNHACADESAIATIKKGNWEDTIYNIQ